MPDTRALCRWLCKERSEAARPGQGIKASLFLPCPAPPLPAQAWVGALAEPQPQELLPAPPPPRAGRALCSTSRLGPGPGNDPEWPDLWLGLGTEIGTCPFLAGPAWVGPGQAPSSHPMFSSGQRVSAMGWIPRSHSRVQHLPDPGVLDATRPAAPTGTSGGWSPSLLPSGRTTRAT